MWSDNGIPECLAFCFRKMVRRRQCSGNGSEISCAQQKDERLLLLHEVLEFKKEKVFGHLDITPVKIQGKAHGFRVWQTWVQPVWWIVFWASRQACDLTSFQSSILKSCILKSTLFREKGDGEEGKLLGAMAQLCPHKQPGADMHSEFIFTKSSLAGPLESYFLSQRIFKSSVLVVSLRLNMCIYKYICVCLYVCTCVCTSCTPIILPESGKKKAQLIVFIHSSFIL